MSQFGARVSTRRNPPGRNCPGIETRWRAPRRRPRSGRSWPRRAASRASRAAGGSLGRCLLSLPSQNLRSPPQHLCRIPVQRSERSVRLTRTSASRLDTYLDDAEGALDDPLHGIHRLYVIQRYRPFVLLEDALAQPEGVAGDRVGRGPPGEKPQSAASAATTMRPSRKRVIVHRLNPWLTRRTTPGRTSPLTQRRSVFMAPTSMATGWRRCSELILLPGQLGDAVTRSRRRESRARGSGLARPRCKRPRSRARTGAAVVPAWCPHAGCGPAARACG